LPIDLATSYRGCALTEMIMARMTRRMKATQSNFARSFTQFCSVPVKEATTPKDPISNENTHIMLSPISFAIAFLMVAVNAIASFRNWGANCRYPIRYSQGIKYNQIRPPIPTNESSIAFSLTRSESDLEHTTSPPTDHVNKGRSERGIWSSRIHRIRSHKILASWPISILVALYVNYLKLDKSGIATVMVVPVICSLLIALYFILKTVPLSPDKQRRYFKNPVTLSILFIPFFMFGLFLVDYLKAHNSTFFVPVGVVFICLALCLLVLVLRLGSVASFKPQDGVDQISRESHSHPTRKEALLFLGYFPLVFFAAILSECVSGHPGIMILGSVVFILYGVGWGFLIGIRHQENLAKKGAC